MQALRARVRRAPERPREYVGHAEGIDLHGALGLPTPTWVEICPEDDGCFLVLQDKQRESLGGSWHDTLEEAKARARDEYGIEDGDWEPADS